MARSPKVEKKTNGVIHRDPKPAKVRVANIPEEMVQVSSLKPHPENYRSHPAGQLAHIEESLKQHGVYRNVVVARDGTLLAGHGVIEAARKLGLKTIAVKRLNIAPDSPQALKILAADNELGRFAEDNDRALSEILKRIAKEDPLGLLGTGYDEKQLAAFLMVTRPASEIRGMNEAAEYIGMPEYDPGGTQYKIVVTFENEADRKKFADSISLKVDKMERFTWSTRWPFTRREDAHSLRFQKQRASGE
jgi:hypothetical protein